MNAFSVNNRTACSAEGNLRQMTEPAKVVTFVGAGGKTTCLQTLTKELDFAGCPVIATTTTKVMPEIGMAGWKGLEPPLALSAPCFWYAETEESGKWVGPSRQAVDAAIVSELDDACSRNETGNRHFWVIEGDGANRKNLKCWADYEPQVPWRTDCAVLIASGDLWGKVLHSDQVHRPEACGDLLGHIWNAENAWRYYLQSPLFYPEFKHMSWIVLLNAPGLAEQEQILTALAHGWHEAVSRKESWMEGFPNPDDWPVHLRLAAGDAKKGRLQWLDLW